MNESLISTQFSNRLSSRLIHSYFHTRANMQFIETILPSLRVWQFFCLSPFALTKKARWPKIERYFDLFCIAYIVVESAVLVHGFVFTNYYLDWKHYSVVLVYGDFVTMTLARVLAILIVIESWKKRCQQINFLEKISKADSILAYRLNINLRYEANRRESSRKSIMWLLSFVALQVIFLTLLISDPLSQRMLRFWLTYTVPFFICSLRYHQMVTYVRLLRLRFKAINNFIQSFCLLNQGQVINHDLLRIMQPAQSESEDRKRSLYKKLIEIRAVYQLLYEASENINGLFRWTLPINIANDFQKGLTNIFFFLTITLQWESGSLNTKQVPRPLVWAIYNIGQILILSNACQHACKEAEMIPALLHQIDFNVNDHQLAGLVCLHTNFEHTRNNNLILQIQLFSMQLIRQKVNFTAFGLLNVDYTLIFTVHVRFSCP